MNALFSKTVLAATAVLAIASAALPASAGEVHNRVANQQARINKGVKSGQLTQHEYDKDESRLNRINASRDRDLAKNGGHLTGAEKANLNRRLNGDSKQIHFTKHNLAHQPGAPTQ